MIILPPKGQWVQENRGDASGSLWSSFSLNLTEETNKTKLSPRTIITTNGLTDLGCPVSFKVFGGRNYALAGAYTWRTADKFAETVFAKTSLGSDPSTSSSDYDDMEVFDSKVWASAGNKLYYTSGSSWSFYDNGGGSSGMTATSPHKMLAFNKTNRLYVCDSLIIKSVAAGSTTLTSSGTYTFTLNSSMNDLLYTGLLQDPNYIWILTINPNNQKSYIITWDGITQDTPTNVYPLESRGALAGIIKDGTPYIIDSDAKLMKFNGGAFVMEPNGRLPIKFGKYLKNSMSTKNDRWIHPNGITLENGRINILVNNEYNDASATTADSLQSGVWEYDPNVGWYHKRSLSMTLASDGTIKDYGQNRLSRVGALSNVKPLNSSSNTYIGNMLIGAAYSTDTTTAVNAIWTNDSTEVLQKYGYFVSPFIRSSQIRDNWMASWSTFRRFLDSNDKIVIKYRTTREPTLDITMTWATNSSFTTSTDLTNYVGYEVEVTLGYGSGLCSHITSVTNNSGTYTVTLDETYPNVVAVVQKAKIQNFTKAGDFSNQLQESEQFNFAVIGERLQVKVCMKFTGDDEVHRLFIENSVAQALDGGVQRATLN